MNRKYYVMHNDGLHETQGEIIKIDGIEYGINLTGSMFISSKYGLTELKTGVLIGEASTKKEIKEQAKQYIERLEQYKTDHPEVYKYRCEQFDYFIQKIKNQIA